MVPARCPRPRADDSYTPAQLYELVSDVPAYVTFIPFCTESTVLHADGRPNHAWKPGQAPFKVEAELAVGFGGLEERYVSNVVGVPFERVSVSCCVPAGSSRPLLPRWSFLPLSPWRTPSLVGTHSTVAPTLTRRQPHPRRRPCSRTSSRHGRSRPLGPVPPSCPSTSCSRSRTLCTASRHRPSSPASRTRWSRRSRRGRTRCTVARGGEPASPRARDSGRVCRRPHCS